MNRPQITILGIGTAWIIFCLCRFIIAYDARLSAQDRAIPSPDRLQSVSATPVMDMSGTPVAFILRATFQTIEAKPSGEITSIPAGSVEVDLLKSNGSVVVGGELTYDKEIADLLTALAWREYRKVNPDPLPVRRRALRQP